MAIPSGPKMKDTTQTNSEDDCPRCRAARLRGWDELDEGEREVARRRGGAARRAAGEEARGRWCVRCWYEDRQDSPRTA